MAETLLELARAYLIVGGGVAVIFCLLLSAGLIRTATMLGSSGPCWCRVSS